MLTVSPSALISRIKHGVENAELQGGTSIPLRHSKQEYSSSHVHYSDKAKGFQSMSKSVNRKEQRAPADLFLIKRTVSAPASERPEDFAKSTQYYREYDGGAQRSPHGRNVSTSDDTGKAIAELPSKMSLTSLGTTARGRKTVKDSNIYRSKSRPLEQQSALGTERRASRDTGGSSMDVEFESCRRRLQKLVSHLQSDNIKTIMDHCKRLEALVRNFVLKAPELCSSQEFGAKLWNSSHYFVIEAMRKQMHEPSCLPAMKDQLLTFLGSSVEFYSDLVTSIEDSYGFDVTQLVTGRAEFTGKGSKRMVMIGACLCQWCYIYLGDLARYREQLASKPDWSKPREYYFYAQQLAPKDGRPYNQLAVIAISAQRRLDAVYFYMRSLSAKNPCMSAHDSLVGIFEDTCRKAKKVEEEEKMRRSAGKEQKKRGPKTSKHHSGKGLEAVRRKETWVMPGTEEWLMRHAADYGAVAVTAGDSKPVEGGPTAEQPCEQIVTSELTRNLTSAFLAAHGKLFTKIGVESFGVSLKKFLALWQRVQQAQVTMSDSSLAVKMVVINIFNVHHVAQNCDSEAGRNIYCGMAFCLALELCTAVFCKCLEHLELSKGSTTTEIPPLVEGPQQARGTRCSAHNCGQDSLTSQTSSPSDHGLGAPHLGLEIESVAVRLPAVKLWFDWLACQQDFWTSFLPVVDKKTLRVFWSTLFQFLNRCLILYLHEVNSVCLSPKAPLLWEDKVTAGFMPLKTSTSTEEIFAIVDAMQLTPEQHRVQCLVRVAVIVKICRDLCTNLGRLLDIGYDVVREQFYCVPVVEEEEEEELNKTEVDGGDQDGLKTEETSEQSPLVVAEDEEVSELLQIVGEQNVEENISDGDDVMAIDKLKKERDKLSKEVELRHHAIENAQTLINEAVNKASEEVYVEPKYLVPDTNCFISSLPSIRTLVNSQLFVVAIPLTVMAELEGLSKGSDVEPNTMSAKISSAKDAMEYARTEILKKSNYLKLLTTQGSLLSSLSLKEEVVEEASNDNLILKSSLNLHTKMDKRIKGGDFYSVVLLTDDRNLRVKAHANSLPVKDMPAFMLMARLLQ